MNVPVLYNTHFIINVSMCGGAKFCVYSSPCFTVNRLSFNKSIGREYHILDSFVIYLCIEGSANILYGSGMSEGIKAGETILIPSDLKEIILKPTKFATILEIFIK